MTEDESKRLGKEEWMKYSTNYVTLVSRTATVHVGCLEGMIKEGK